MNKLAYLALGILVERFHQHLTQPKRIESGWLALSVIWRQAESLYCPASFEEMQAALNALIEEGLVVKEREFMYSFRVTRVEFAKQSA
jgi:hypothetical protein